MTSTSKKKKNRTGYIALGALALVVMVAIVVILGLVASEVRSTATSVAAQDDELAAAKEQKIEIPTPTSEVVDLTNLIGLTKNEAVSHIKRGATIDKETRISENNLVTKVDITLSDEKGDTLSGTPSVVLKLDDQGRVQWISYTASITSLGYPALSFTETVDQSKIVQKCLKAAGIQGADDLTITLPTNRKSYVTYEADEKTSAKEQYTFHGISAVGEVPYTWSVTLLYDYSEANATGNLANTIRKVTVSVSSAA